LQLSSLQLIDVLGNVITTKELKSKEETIDVSAISNGIYFIKIFSAQGDLFESKKVIVQH